MDSTRPQSEDTASDTHSDPAKGADDSTDWSDEGGATPAGPATDSEAP